MTRRRLTAWLVHLYTASGGVIGMFALLYAAQGQIRESFLLLCVTMLIDATDGMLARKVDVRRALPGFDGAMVDNVIDFLTYIWVPVFILASQNILPHPVWVAVPILAGLYAYGQVDMKTPDSFFLGFPSYWNFVALYLWWLRPEPNLALVLVIIPAVLTFIPTRYLYPSKNRILSVPTWILGLIWAVLVLYLLLQDTPDQRLVIASLFYPAWYMILSFYIDWKIRRERDDSRAYASS
jgi:phosphatidylcholine synthase